MVGGAGNNPHAKSSSGKPRRRSASSPMNQEAIKTAICLRTRKRLQAEWVVVLVGVVVGGKRYLFVSRKHWGMGLALACGISDFHLML